MRRAFENEATHFDVLHSIIGERAKANLVGAKLVSAADAGVLAEAHELPIAVTIALTAIAGEFPNRNLVRDWKDWTAETQSGSCVLLDAIRHASKGYRKTTAQQFSEVAALRVLRRYVPRPSVGLALVYHALVQYHGPAAKRLHCVCCSSSKPKRIATELPCVLCSAVCRTLLVVARPPWAERGLRRHPRREQWPT